MTQTQEEMLLIGAFGLFWLCKREFAKGEPHVDIFIAFLVILRAFRSRGVEPVVGGTDSAAAAAPMARTGGTSRRPDWCGPDDVLCVVEEWKYSRY